MAGRGARRRGAALLAAMMLVAQAAGLLALLPSPAQAALAVCAIPGVDGPPAAPLTGVVNSYYPGTADAAANARAISVGPARAGGGPAIGVGDMLLVVQVQDATINSTNTDAYGDGVAGGPATGYTGLRSTGLYEYVRATGAIAAGVVPILGAGGGGGLLNTYHALPTTAGQTQRKFEVVRVPQYSSVSFSSTLTAANWDGDTGGILAVDVTGTLNLNAATITMQGFGFRGGAGRQLNGDAAQSSTDYTAPAPVTPFAGDPQAGVHGSKGGGIAGSPRWTFDPVLLTTVDNGVDGLPNGSFARGAPGNAGGGGTDGAVGTNQENSGGGGGANGGTGGQGGHTWNSNLDLGGFGGTAVPGSVTRLFLGGGGGAGSKNNNDGDTKASAGNGGGGAVLLRVGAISGAGTINANGAVAYNNTLNDGGGGGGAGGSVVVSAPVGVPLTGLTIHADGGRGGDTWNAHAGGAFPGSRHGPGGGGGGGVIVTSSPPTAQTAVAGANGITTLANDPYGATPGSAGVTATAPISSTPGVWAGATCLPQLTVTKSTSTPTVVQTAAGTSATYTVTVANAAGQGDAINTSISDTLPAGFTYAATSAVNLAGGASRPSTTNPAPGDAVPTWGSFAIPGGGQVQVAFTVNIAGGVALGTYQNPARATYSDPARTTAGGTLSSQYTPGAGTPDNVTLVAPDLTIVKSHAGAFVRGSTATYALLATNSGSGPTSGTVTVSDTVPAGLTPTGAAGTGWTCPPPAGQSLTCSRSDALAAGASYPAIIVSVNVLQGAANSVTNTATVAGGGELNTANDSSSDITAVTSSADIAITKSVNNPTPNVGTSVVFTITATNNGPSNATGVVVTDLLPAGLTFVSATASQGAYTPATGIWTVGAVNSGQAPTLQLVATVSAPGAKTNTATKTAENEPDPNSANNSSSAGVNGQQADIAIAKTVNNAAPNVGTNVTFTVTATNRGPSNATGVVVTDLLPAGLSFVSATPSQGTYNSGTGVWAVGSIANGSAPTLQVVATITTPGNKTNTATRTAGDQPDNNPGNDSAQASVDGQQADIAITKTVDSAAPNVGTNVTFTVTATNNGPSSATGVVVTDLLPAGLTLVLATPSQGIYNAGTGTWAVGSIANGSAPTLQVVATVTTPGSKTNIATRAASDQPDNNPGNDTAQASVNGQQADIAITKTVDVPAPNVGQNVTFTVTATNNGPSSATGVVVTDLLPSGLGLVSATPSQGTYNGATGVWTVGAIANGAARTLVLVARVTSSGAKTNTATRAASDQPDNNGANDSASATVTPQQADVSLAKTVSNPAPNVGQNVTFTVTATNNGPSSATGVVVTDLLPAGLTLVSATPSQGAYSVVTGAWTVGTIASGTSRTLLVVATVATPGVHTNTATKTAEDQFDPNTGNDSAAASVNGQQADIAVTKTVDNPKPNVGTNVTFTVTATNNGPSGATGVVLTDLLPAGLALVSATPSQGTYNGASGLWTVGALANGGLASLQVVATVSTAGNHTNTVTRTGGDQPDNNAANDSAGASVNGQLADIAVTKTVDNPAPNVGTNVTFTVTATNNGPSGATGVAVTDLLPGGLTFVSASPSQGLYNAATGVWTVGTIANGQAPTLQVVATVTTAGNHTNTAARTAGDQPDNNPGNDSASVVVNGQQADIGLTKTVSNAAPNAGTNVTFTVTATNNGPSNATGVVVTDLLPAGLTLVSATASPGTYNNVTGAWNVGAINNGAAGTLLVVATVTTAGNKTNTATRTAGNQPDPNTANDTASASVNGQQADIAISKTVDNPTPNVGGSVTFTVTASNNGPSGATGVVVTDLLPAGLLLVSANPSQGTYNSGTGVWTIGAIPNGMARTLQVVAIVTQPGAITNTATKTAADQPDPNAANDAASAMVNGQRADIAIAKVVDNPTPNVGANVTFTVTASNNGPSTATGVVVTDLLPAGLGLVTATPSQGTYNSATGVWTIGAIANGAGPTLVMVATVATPGTHTNTATKTAEDQPDPTAADDTASASVTGQQADIAVSKTVNNPSPFVGSQVTFTVTAANNGPSGATGVVVTDLLPAGLALVSATPSQGTYTSATGAWSVGAIANGAASTLQLVATVTGPGQFTNTASRTAGNQPDNNPANDTGSATVVTPSADIAVAKTVSNPTPNAGTNVTFTVSATDNGPDNASGVAVTDLLPAGLTFVSATPSQGTYDSASGVWTVGAVASGARKTLLVVATVTGTTPVTNTATKTAENESDFNPGNNSAAVVVTGQRADIGIAKIVDNATPNVGGNVIFTVTATDNGPSNATGVVVTDLLPAGLSLVSATPSQGTYDSATGAWAVGAIANGAVKTLQLVATVTTPGSKTNTATRTASDQPDPNAANDSASASVNGQQADVAIAKTVDNPTPNVGSNVTFTITATDNGPSNATGVVVTDLLPTGLAFVSATPSQGTYTSATGAWNVGAIANGAAKTLQLVATVTQPGILTNIATRSAGDQPDNNPANDSAAASVSGQQAEVAISKTVSNAAPNVGTNVTFTVTATNNGPSTATGVVVTDLLPAALSFVSAAPSQGGYNSATGAWTAGIIANGASATLQVVATVTQPGLSTNTATKTAEDQPDPNSGNNTASAAVTGQLADIAVTKAVDNAAPNVGSNVTFAITATDNGPSGATGVVITDILPAGLSFVSATASQGTYNSLSGAWAVGAIGNGATKTLQLVATVTTAGVKTNTATRTAADQPDPNAGNNSASASVNGQLADIGITKTVNLANPNVGSNVTFTITAANAGPSDATSVAVTDLLPAGLAFVSAAPSQGTYNPGTGAWNIGSIPNGTSQTLLVVATVSTAGNHVNTATKTSEDQADNNPANDRASASVNGQLADVGLLKVVDNPAPLIGQNVTFTVTATNNGPSDATGVVVTDLLPAGLTFFSAFPSQGTYNRGTGVWAVGAIANGASRTMTVTATVTTPGAKVNTATRTGGDQPDNNAANDSASAAVTPPQADVAVTKTVDNARPNVGTSVTFTITATNNGPSRATGVVVTDLLPAGLSFVSATASQGSYTSGTGIWNIGAINNGAAGTLQVVATVTTPGPQTNTATKTAEDQFDPTSADDSAGALVNGQQGDVAITKTVDNASPNVGTDVTFTVTATNNGPSGVSGVVVTDPLPAGLALLSANPSQGTYNPGTGAWTVGAIANGAGATLQVVATVTTPGTKTNTAAKTAQDQPDPNPNNDSASASVNGRQADIAVTKTVSNPMPNVGTNVTFTVTATNNGPSDATRVVVTDLLPAGLTLVSATPSQGTYNPATGAWAVGAMVNGAGPTLQVVATVTTPGNKTNTATRTAADQPDPNAANDSASASVNGQQADIAITKTVSNPVPNVGQTVTFTVTATNHGPNGATGLVVHDQLPAGLTLVSSSPSQGTYNALTGDWTIGAIANGAFTTLMMVATVNQAGTITNTATKTAETQSDPTPGDDSASTSLNGQEADIAVTKTVSNPTPNAGTNVTFTITVKDNGPSDATGVAVIDLLPAGLVFISASPSQGTYNAATGLWTIGGVPNGTSRTLQVLATVTGTTPVTNTATKTAEVQSDFTRADDTASVSVTGQQADVAVTKTVDNAAPLVDQNVTFTVTAVNNGPSPATGVVVTDLLPAGLSLVSATPSQGTYDAVTGAWVIGAIANGTNRTLQVTATVTQPGAVTNTATKTAADQPDPTSGNDTASVTVTPQQADVAVTKTVDNPTPNVGSNVTFTVIVTNNGPGAATGVVVTDVLPAGLAFVSATASGTNSAGTVTWNLVAIPNGAGVTLQVVATVTAPGIHTNTATKSHEDQFDPNRGNDSGSVSLTGQAADIAVAKTVNNASPLVGSQVTFTVTATDNGPSDATGVVVTDLLPSGLALVAATPSQGTYNSVTGAWVVGAIPNGSSRTLQVTATVTQAGNTTNTATRTAGDQPDPNTVNDAAAASVNGQQADIGLTKVASAGAPNVASQVTFTVTATNHGPSDATGVVVTDVLPAGLALVSATPSQGTYTNATGAWAVGAIANGVSKTLQVVAAVTQPGSITNTATRTAQDQPDPNPGNDTASATIDVPAAADIQVSKAVDRLTPNVGSNVTYTIAAHNAGPSPATGVQLTDQLPAGLSFVSAATSQGAYSAATGVWTVGALANGATATLTITAIVNQVGSILNTATKTSEDQFDPNTSNDTAGATTNGQAAADLSTVKTASAASVPVGQTVTYTVTEHDNGPLAASGVVVHDLLGAGLAFVSATPSQGTYNPATGTWTVGALASGASATLLVTATVTQVGSIPNTASETAQDQADPNPNNDTSTVDITGTPSADIQVTKSVDNTAPALNSNVVFTVRAINHGPQGATGVQVGDPLPPGLAIVSASASQGGYNAATGAWTVGALANGATATLTITATVTTTGPHTNTATKTAEAEFDPNTSNDQASAMINAPSSADIAVLKTVDNPTPNLGSNVTFTVTATNRGPDQATGVQLTDLLPAGLALVVATPSQGTYTGATGVWSVGTLPNAATATLRVTATVTRNGAITNTATRAAGDQGDPTPADDSASAVVAVPPAADVAVAKTVDDPSPLFGSSVHFTVSAHNNGPDGATGVQLTDLVPAGLTLVTAAASQGTFTIATGVWTVGALANGSTATLVLTVTVDQVGRMTNTATKNAETQFDPNPVNDTASATVNVRAAADIGVTKTVDVAAPPLGSNVTFTVTATNHGPNGATGVVVTDLLPAGLTFVSATPTQGTYAAGSGAWAVGTLANGAFAGLAVVATVTQPAAATNTAARTAGDQVDNNPANDSASASITPLFVDLALHKTLQGGLTVGQDATYLLAVVNQGTAPTTGPITVTDTLPAGLSLVSAAGPGWTCAAVGQVVTCTNPGPIAAGAGSTITLLVRVVPGTLGSVVNTATVTTAGDIDASNDSSSATGVVSSVPPPPITAPPTPKMPVTGRGEWLPQLLVALALVAAGAVLLLLGGRRRAPC